MEGIISVKVVCKNMFCESIAIRQDIFLALISPAVAIFRIFHPHPHPSQTGLQKVCFSLKGMTLLYIMN